MQDVITELDNLALNIKERARSTVDDREFIEFSALAQEVVTFRNNIVRKFLPGQHLAKFCACGLREGEFCDGSHTTLVK